MRLVFAIWNWVLDLSILRVEEPEDEDEEGDTHAAVGSLVDGPSTLGFLPPPREIDWEDEC